MFFSKFRTEVVRKVVCSGCGRSFDMRFSVFERRILCYGLGLQLLLGAYALADVRRREITGDFKEIEGLFSHTQRTTVSSVHASPHYSPLKRPLKFSGRLAGMGRLRGVLSLQRLITWDTKSSDFVLLQGEGQLLSKAIKQEVPSFATLVRSSQSKEYLLRLFIPTVRRKNDEKQHLSEFALYLKGHQGTYKVSKIKHVRSRNKITREHACGTPHYTQPHAHVSKAPLTTAATLQVAEITMEADTEYATRIGTDLSQEMSTVLNGVDTLYRRDLGITFQPNINTTPQVYSQQITYDQNYNMPIHTEMAQKVDPLTRDMHVLLTGKDPVHPELQSLAGAVPDLGAICRAPELAVGFTIRWVSGGYISTVQDDILTTAHEVGHSFGGEHDDDQTTRSTRGIMHSGTTAVDNEITAFSTYSQNQIGSHIASYSSCLNTTEGDRGIDDGTTDPAVGTLGSIIGRRNGRRRMMFRTLDTDGYRLGSVALEIFCAESVDGTFTSQLTASTNRRGKLFVRGYPGIWCKAVSGSVESNVVSLPSRR
jgi:Metallo-peptidase family M12